MKLTDKQKKLVRYCIQPSELQWKRAVWYDEERDICHNKSEVLHLCLIVRHERGGLIKDCTVLSIAEVMDCDVEKNPGHLQFLRNEAIDDAFKDLHQFLEPKLRYYKKMWVYSADEEYIALK